MKVQAGLGDGQGLVCSQAWSSSSKRMDGPGLGGRKKRKGDLLGDFEGSGGVMGNTDSWDLGACISRWRIHLKRRTLARRMS